eukprot:scaffold83631_cov21-Tisochrysis_lutea.AAC.3
MEQIAINKSHCAVLVGGLHWATMKALCKVTICCKKASTKFSRPADDGLQSRGTHRLKRVRTLHGKRRA